LVCCWEEAKMSEVEIRQKIQDALHNCSKRDDFTDTARKFFAALGYGSNRTAKINMTPAEFVKRYPPFNQIGKPKSEIRKTKSEEKFLKAAKEVHMLFQFTGGDIEKTAQLFDETFDIKEKECFVFCAVDIEDDKYTRERYATYTREINKRLNSPAVVLFRCNKKGKWYLTLSFVRQRENLLDPERAVLGRVSLLREIKCKDTHRGHINILAQLELNNRVKWIDDNDKPRSFKGLLDAWLNELDTEALNKRFYKELREWYERAVKSAKFPNARTNEGRSEHVIRMLSRILFIWFIKEKDLVKEDLFIEKNVMKLLTKSAREQGDCYYRAILQNLFFATLNTKIKKRGFRPPNSERVFHYYRYKSMLSDPKTLERWLELSPFVNGGLFECLDSQKPKGKRVDCFTDDSKAQKQLSVKDSLFFSKNKNSKGLFAIFENYKFTVEENTPIEQEVALDPELLGKVFEEFLGHVVSEKNDASEKEDDVSEEEGGKRKETGSYYTPRVIVDYMVRESLLAYFCRKMPETEEDTLRSLLTEEVDYEQVKTKLGKKEIQKFIEATGELRLLDPAVGSGAFPMGALAKLTMALKRIDPENNNLRKHEERVANMILDSRHKEAVLDRIEKDFSEKNQYNSYTRKLLLIRESIFGVDIQKIAVQICRLRFFISLTIEQVPSKSKKDNYGIQPLPNLETKIVAADTLIKIGSANLSHTDEVKKLEQAIKDIREKFFSVTDREVKDELRENDKDARQELADELERLGLPSDEADKIVKWDLYAHDEVANWFSADWMFGVEGGFDVVIGNPPYIQLQNNMGLLADYYEPQDYNTFDALGDIYVLFYERGLQLCRGHLCYITSNQWMRAGYGNSLRNLFLDKNPSLLLDVGPDVFGATVDTNILLIQNDKNQNELEACTITAENIAEAAEGAFPIKFKKDEIWSIVNPKEQELQKKLKDVGTPISLWPRVSTYRGITTGYNDAFIINENKRQEILEDCADVAERTRTDSVMRKIMRGRGIRRYYTEWAGLYLLFIPWHFPLHEDFRITGASPEAEGAFKSEYPALYKHFKGHKKRLSARNRTETGVRYEWYALQRYANTFLSEFEKEKIVWKRVGSMIRFSQDLDETYILDSCCLLTGGNIKYLTAVLNSKLLNYQILKTAPRTGMGDVIISIQAIGPLPVPVITDANLPIVQQIEVLVTEIRTTKEKGSDADTSAKEAEIDKLVYKLYGLTEDEIAIVEEQQ